MIITGNTLPSWEDRSEFRKGFTGYVEGALRKVNLIAELSETRIYDTHYAWRSDVERVERRESKLVNGLDHFKLCGHLAYWLRRMSPVVEFHDSITNIADSEGYALSNREAKFRDLLHKYLNEYLAFDLGFQICLFYEGNRVSHKGIAPKMNLEYYETTCNMMKFKNVSPHSLFVIYKSLFM